MSPDLPHSPTGVSQAPERHPLTDPNVWRWLSGFGLGTLGDAMFFVVFGWVVASVADAGTVGLVMGAGVLVRTLVMLPAGALADRIGVKATGVWANVARVLVLAALAGILAVTTPGVGVLLVVGLAFGVADAVFLPAVSALPGRLAPMSQVSRLQAGRATVQRLSTAAGGPLAGLLVAALGDAATTAVAAVLTGCSALALALTRVAQGGQTREAPHDAQRPSLLAETREGLWEAVRHPYAFTLILAATIVEFSFAGPMNTGLPLLAREQGWGAAGVGLLLGSFGLGAGVTAGVLAVSPPLRRAGRLLAFVTPVMGMAIVGIGLAPTLPLALASAVLLGSASGLVGTTTASLVLAAAPDALAARFMSLLTFGAFAGGPLSYAVMGWSVAAFGATASYAAFGVLGIVTALGLVAFTRIRTLMLPAPELTTPGAPPGP